VQETRETSRLERTKGGTAALGYSPVNKEGGACQRRELVLKCRANEGKEGCVLVRVLVGQTDHVGQWRIRVGGSPATVPNQVWL